MNRVQRGGGGRVNVGKGRGGEEWKYENQFSSIQRFKIHHFKAQQAFNMLQHFLQTKKRAKLHKVTQKRRILKLCIDGMFCMFKCTFI